MKTLRLILSMVFFVCVPVFADRTLSADEVRGILNSLTQQAVQTWLPYGSISARHLEYSSAEKSVCEYRETAHFDGVRFYREISLISGENETESNGSSGQQNSIEMDRERIFCWDGISYTQYFRSSDTAIVKSRQSQAPLGIYGVFRAGIIPWGYGIYTLENLTRYDCTAQEVWVDQHRQIHLQMSCGNSSPLLQMSFVLDAEKNYAVTSVRMEDPQLSGIEQYYSQFVQVNNRWIPMVISTERFLKKAQGKEIVSYEDWKIESIKPDMPQDAHFSVPLKNGTLVELHTSNFSKSLMYYANDQMDIRLLLEEKSAFSNQQDAVQKNCAAAAVQLVSKQLARPYPASQIDALAGQNNAMTSLHLLKGKLEETGLYCTALETSLDSLRNTKNAQIILHLPDNGHYVVLDHIDNKNVWTIDLTSRKVYWKTPIQQFLQQWKRGIALVVSDNPQNLSTEGTPLSTSDQQQIMGGDTTGRTYSCTEKIQASEDLLCSEPVGILCGGLYYTYWERYGCREDPNGGVCTGDEMPGHVYTDCITDFYYPGSCTVSGQDRYRPIRACQ